MRRPSRTERAQPNATCTFELVAGLVLLAFCRADLDAGGVELLSVIIGLFGLVYLLRAFQGWRKNR